MQVVIQLHALPFYHKWDLHSAFGAVGKSRSDPQMQQHNIALKD